jgi:riboflavin synthase
MFFGIIEATGKIKKIEKNFFTISHSFQEKFNIGDSIACSGMCATILESDSLSFKVEIMAESRKRTVFGTAKVGDEINLERSAKMNARNSGHFVTGHIDEVGEILERKKIEDYEYFKIKISNKNAQLVVEKGSVSLDGISLTIASCGENWFSVAIISHTLKVTNLAKKQVGDQLNLEFDILGKYILRAKELNE